MVTIWEKEYQDQRGTEGKIRIGWASWDKGAHKTKSVKWAYKDTSGKISRGSPEAPFDVLIEMLLFSLEKNELSAEQIKYLKDSMWKNIVRTTQNSY